jgi:hypothetical protein
MWSSWGLCSPLVTHVHLLYQTIGHRAITSEEGPEPGQITMCFVVCKTTSELECVILTTLYLPGAKNTNRGLYSRACQVGSCGHDVELRLYPWRDGGTRGVETTHGQDTVTDQQARSHAMRAGRAPSSGPGPLSLNFNFFSSAGTCKLSKLPFLNSKIH